MKTVWLYCIRFHRATYDFDQSAPVFVHHARSPSRYYDNKQRASLNRKLSGRIQALFPVALDKQSIRTPD
jgi:hypothetical protein